MEPIRIIPLQACCKKMEETLTYSVRAQGGIRTEDNGTAYLIDWVGHPVPCFEEMKFCSFCGTPLAISGATRRIVNY